MEAPLPKNEKERLAVLWNYRVLDSPRESDFDEIVRLAAHICDTPISLVSLVDRDRQWFKGRYGLEISETPRKLSFCAHAILQPSETLEVPDATLDERFKDNELVNSGPQIRFYAGAPLVAPEGHGLGTLCVIDFRPRRLTQEQLWALRVLSRQVMTQLELRRRFAELQKASGALAETHEKENIRHEALERRLQGMLDELEHFSYTITHDLRAPLRAMQGFAEILSDDAEGHLTAEEMAYVSRIRAAAERMDGLIKDALEYSKAVKSQFELTPVKVDELLHEMSATYPEFQDSSVLIEIQSPLPPVLANKSGLTQCFSNLLNNAIKFRKPGRQAHVIIWGEKRDNVERLWFEDNGIGISSEDQKQLFQMFKKLNHSYQGTGIGLALVRKAAERMGGRVGVESELGVGSRFWLEFKKTEASTDRGRALGEKSNALRVR